MARSVGLVTFPATRALAVNRPWTAEWPGNIVSVANLSLDGTEMTQTVFASGNFNVLHLRLLRFARELGDRLIVGVQSDRLAGEAVHIARDLRLAHYLPTLCCGLSEDLGHGSHRDAALPVASISGGTG